MKILHTSDWHLGKTLKGESRLDEQEQVCAELVALAKDERPDLVLVVGDVFESAVPPPEAERLAWRTFLDLRATGAEVLVVAGNHDHPHRFDALSPVAAAAGITVRGHVAPPQAGGVVEVTTAKGERARVALVPWVSPRAVVRALDLFELDVAESAQKYAARVSAVVQALCAGGSSGGGSAAASATAGTVNLLALHGMLRGGKLGGGERDAQTVDDYGLDPTAFPPSLHYVALGHLHRTQQLGGAAPTWYSGSPIAVDFGEEADTKQVLLVDATATTPAKVTPVPLTKALRLRTIRGPLAELDRLVGTTGSDYLRVIVEEPARAGLAEQVRERFPNALEVRIAVPADAARDGGRAEQAVATREGKTPHELFAQFLAEREPPIADPRLDALFAELLEEAVAADAEEVRS